MMTDEEKIIEDRAKEFARENKNTIAKEITNTGIFLPDQFPVSVFMAGSPGAGKTESSKNLIARFTKNGHSILRIDSDDLRSRFAEYTGANSDLFVGATSIIADKIHDYALKNKQSFVFDGTLSNLERSRDNIRRSLDKKQIRSNFVCISGTRSSVEFRKSPREERWAKDTKNGFSGTVFFGKGKCELSEKRIWQCH